MRRAAAVLALSFAVVPAPSLRAVTTPQILDNLTVVKGSHVFRTGVNFRLYRHNDQRGQPGGTNVTV